MVAFGPLPDVQRLLEKKRIVAQSPILLRVIYNRGLHLDLLNAAITFLDRLRERGAISGYALHECAETHLFDIAGQGGVDAVLTSTAYHFRLPEVSSLLGTAPIGLNRAQKLAWMESPIGRQFQFELFHNQFGVVPSLIYLGQDSVGVFSNVSLEQDDSLSGQRVATSGYRRIWWLSRGATVIAADAFLAMQLQKENRIEVSTFLPHGGAQSYLEQISSHQRRIDSLRYYQTSEFMSAATGHILWNPETFATIQERFHGEFEASRRYAIETTESHLQQAKRLALENLAKRVEVRVLPRDMELSFQSFGEKVCKNLVHKWPNINGAAPEHLLNLSSSYLEFRDQSLIRYG